MTASAKYTPTQILKFARDGKIDAFWRDAQSVPALCDTDSADAYPCVTIDLEIDGKDFLEIKAWKCVYRASGNDPLNGEQILPQGAWKTVSHDGDGQTSGDCSLSLSVETNGDENTEADCGTPIISFSTGEGMPKVREIMLPGLTEDEAQEVMDAIELALNEAYSDWTPQDASDEDIYDALVAHNPRETLEVDGISVNIHASTHLGQPLYAVEGDEDQTVYDSALDAAKGAKMMLEAKLDEIRSKIEDIDVCTLAETLRIVPTY